jgi:hypothetical protein
MSRVKAYGCDMCGKLQHEDIIVGVENQEDMFDRLKSFKTIMNPDKTQAHYCHECYETQVLFPARSMVNRKNDEQGYINKLNELQYNLRKTTVLHWREKKFFKHL